MLRAQHFHVDRFFRHARPFRHTRERGYPCAVLLLLSLISCGETFDSNYPDRKAVEEDGAIRRGWIPKVIPAGARKIHEWHDIGTNEGFGSFEVSASDLPSMVSEMESVAATETVKVVRIDKRPEWEYRFRWRIDREGLEEQGFTLFRYSYFYLAIHQEHGRAFFWNTYP